MPHHFNIVDTLIEPPVKRAAYSDRTAWLMSVMSALAYVPFEQGPPLDELAEQLAKETQSKKIVTSLKALLLSQKHDQNVQLLKADLDTVGFELVRTFDISIPLVADTQAFLARLNLHDRDPMLVLAFRGTEVKKAEDVKANITANPVDVGPSGEGHQVHSGFYSAFKSIQPSLENTLGQPELSDMPLYITGHSLGGALAVVATYCISNDSVGACYTFGSPRVGNLVFGQSIKTPVYRVVNASDLVPRLPPSFFIEILTLFLRWLPIIPYNQRMANWLETFRHYRHYGDLRYLSAVVAKAPKSAGQPVEYPGMQVIANPPQLSRWIWLAQRMVATLGRSGIADHAIKHYVDKLAWWAILRNQGKYTLKRKTSTLSPGSTTASPAGSSTRPKPKPKPKPKPRARTKTKTAPRPTSSKGLTDG